MCDNPYPSSGIDIKHSFSLTRQYYFYSPFKIKTKNTDDERGPGWILLEQRIIIKEYFHKH